jgi:predicted amidohydrolase
VGFEGGKGFVGCSLVVDPFAVTRLEGPVGKEALLKAEVNLDDVSVARATSPMLADLEANLADIRREIDQIERAGRG